MTLRRRLTFSVVPRSGDGAAAAGAAAGAAGAGAAGAAGAGAAGAAAAGEPLPTMASTAPISTVSSVATLISRTVPATGEGISVSTLSVETSSSGSSIATVSPTF